MAKVFLHTYGRKDSEGTHQEAEFERLPVVGEIISLDATSPWYEVRLVVHTPFHDADSDAEVYALEGDHTAILNGVLAEVDRG
jgi:hypothetical protein